MTQAFWARAVVWVTLGAILYVLRSFGLLIFLTFVFAFIQARGVAALANRVPNRTLRVVVVGVGFLTALVLLGMFLAPRLSYETRIFAERFPGYIRSSDAAIYDLVEKYPNLHSVFPSLPHEPPPPAGTEVSLSPSHSVTLTLVQMVLGDGETKDGAQSLRTIMESITSLGRDLMAIGSAFLLSLLFAFLIVLDLESLGRGLRRLKQSTVAWVYDEVVPSVQKFATVLGRALEAQLFIALLNTSLTAPGLWLMGLDDKVIFLSVIVFLCSFIPVAGVFISSAPICLISLQVGGWSLALIAAAYITVIHMIEAYILNPRIYGHHLRLNPVVVLIILTVGGKLFGVWGLILGVPICTYLYSSVLRSSEAR